jgi:tRNA (guanosine-2'-O-)-methyltransferase
VKVKAERGMQLKKSCIKLTIMSLLAKFHVRSATAFTCRIVSPTLSTSRNSICITRLYSSSRSENRRDKAEIRSKLGKSSKELDWEHFDFSDNPKTDNRFIKAQNGNIVAPHHHLDATKEAIEDKKAAKKLQDANEAFLSLDPNTIAEATKILEEYVNDDRIERVRSVLKQRTKRSKFLFENPANPSNVWACLRTIDSFGIQYVDVIIDSGRYAGKKAMTQKRGMRTAMGSAQWITLRNYSNTKEAVENIRKQGYKIYASDLNPNSKDVRDIDFDSAPICVVMGNEEDGISDEMRALADETFTLPMCGFAESFNLSVATSITLAHMSSKSQIGTRKGPLQPDLDEHEFICLYLKGLFNSLAQKKMGNAILKKNGIILPEEIFRYI